MTTAKTDKDRARDILTQIEADLNAAPAVLHVTSTVEVQMNDMGDGHRIIELRIVLPAPDYYDELDE